MGQLLIGGNEVESLLSEKDFERKFKLQKGTARNLAARFRKFQKGLSGGVVLYRAGWQEKNWFGPKTQPVLANISQYARQWGVSRPAVYRWIKEGLLPTFKNKIDPYRKPPFTRTPKERR